MATSTLSRTAQAAAPGGPSGMVIDQSTWNEEMRKAAPSKQDLNALVLEYLLIEGFSEAAVEFARETGLPHDIDHAMIHERMEIREAVEDGRVEEAVRRVNELDPEILDTNPPLLFHLHLLRLIELIRLDKVDEALEFAATELAPRGAQNQEFLVDLERTMALLAFPDVARFADDSPPISVTELVPARPAPDTATLELLKDPAFAPIMALMRRSQRVRVAKELNAAILESQGQGMETRLGGLVRMMSWGEEVIAKAGVTLPGDERDKGRKWASAILSLESE